MWDGWMDLYELRIAQCLPPSLQLIAVLLNTSSHSSLFIAFDNHRCLLSNRWLSCSALDTCDSVPNVQIWLNTVERPTIRQRRLATAIIA